MLCNVMYVITIEKSHYIEQKHVHLGMYHTTCRSRQPDVLIFSEVLLRHTIVTKTLTEKVAVRHVRKLGKPMRLMRVCSVLNADFFYFMH